MDIFCDICYSLYKKQENSSQKLIFSYAHMSQRGSKQAMKAFHEVRNYSSDFMVWYSTYENISFVIGGKCGKITEQIDKDGNVTYPYVARFKKS